MKKFGKHLTVVLKKMCKMVKVDLEKINFKKENWFWDYTWTEKKQEEFIKWLEGYLMKNKGAREEMLRFPKRDKQMIKKAVQEFVSNYGWKTE